MRFIKFQVREKFVMMIFKCLTGNCRNVLKQLHELIRMERLDCTCCFQQSRNFVFLAKQKIMATRNSILINLMDFSLNGSTQTFQTFNELNTCHILNQHSKVRWRAVARRSSQLKPYLFLGAHPLSRWPSLFERILAIEEGVGAHSEPSTSARPYIYRFISL